MSFCDCRMSTSTPSRIAKSTGLPTSWGESKATNNPLTTPEVREVLATAVELRSRLHDATAIAPHHELSERAEAADDEALRNLAGVQELITAPDLATRLEQLLIEASLDPRPSPPAIADTKPGGFAAWGGGQPRIEAAAGLVSLARGRTPQESDSAIFIALRRLAKDPHWAVRFQVIAHINALWNSDRPLMWSLIEDAAREETDLRILRFFAHTLVTALRGSDPDRVDTIVTMLQERVSDTEDRESIATALSSLLMWRVVVQDHQPSRDRIAAWVASPIASLHYLQDVIHQSRGLWSSI